MERSSQNALTGIFFMILLLVGTLSVILTPFTVREYEELGDEYEYRTFFFGHWDLWKNGDVIDGGGSGDLDNYPMESGILILIGLIFNFIFSTAYGITMSKGHSYYNKHRRIFGSLLTSGNVLGLIGTILQVPYVNYLKSVNSGTIFSFGFILALILFSIFLIAGIPGIIAPQIFEQTNSIVEKNREEMKFR